MLRILRLPCALLALLLSTFAGGRLAAIERHDDDLAKTPLISQAPTETAPGAAQAQLPGLPAVLIAVESWPMALIAGLTVPDCPSLPAPCQRRGSAGGARAP